MEHSRENANDKKSIELQETRKIRYECGKYAIFNFLESAQLNTPRKKTRSLLARLQVKPRQTGFLPPRTGGSSDLCPESGEPAKVAEMTPEASTFCGIMMDRGQPGCLRAAYLPYTHARSGWVLVKAAWKGRRFMVLLTPREKKLRADV
jgi:hypothetical protein